MPQLVLLALSIGLASSFSRWGSGVGHVSRVVTPPNHLAVFSTAMPRHSEEKQGQQNLHVCQGCDRIFNSRNALFRHIRGEDEASKNCSLSMERTATEEEILMTTVIRYGYYDGGESNAATNDIAANLIFKAFVHHAEKAHNFTISTSALTYSTAAKLRRPSLRQDDEVVGATSEVLSFNYRLSSRPMVIAKWREYASSGAMLRHMQAWLEDGDNCQMQIQLHQMDALAPRSSKFYAERSCSQSSYRYLLPVEWILPDSGTSRDEAISEVREWWKRVSSTDSRSFREYKPRSMNQGESKRVSLSPAFIKRLKQSLKALGSNIVPNRRVRRQADRNNRDDESKGDSYDLRSDETPNDTSPIRLAPGRFGQLWRKQRRCWSNFAHPQLTGMERNPAHEAVWRTIDSAKIVGFCYSEEDDTMPNMHVILEFRADGFVMGQVPRMISALVAMTNGWLPQNFIDIATRPDLYLPVLPAPPLLAKRLYFQSARYHFHELTCNGLTGYSNNFEETIQTDSKSEQDWEVELRRTLFGRVTPMEGKLEDEWLAELKDIVSPDLRRQIDVIEKENSAEITDPEGCADTPMAPPLDDTDAPNEYSKTLELLRGVVNEGKWPATSDARSRVIKTPGSKSENFLVTKKRVLASTFPGNAISSGSFTVVNGQIWDSDALPHANALFPELARAVFDLEEEIIQRTSPPLPFADGMERQSSTSLRRSPSTHCAVNRNAQFTPHVDSGRGQGQSVSMIAGLGNYAGGEIFVDGKPYDIRYNALEFDGWKQLHWTAPFNGERYSLVWFTPEMSTKEENRDLQQSQKPSSSEDIRADRLAELHCKAVPFLPKLQYRHDSTDALVINELLDLERGSAYTAKGFAVKNHQCVLDVGAHIGVFSRYAIAEGCHHIIAYEPEPSNFEILSKNLAITLQPAPAITIDLHSSAVAQGSFKSRTLVRARHTNEGRQNTWRHSLEEYSQYVDRSTKMPSKAQKGTLDRLSVQCIPFFGGALVQGVTFVKLDCEGAEIDILLSDDASKGSSWLDVTHLVVEWSFTKDRRVRLFHEAMENLRDAGFAVCYEGMGSWWDTDISVVWPYPNDIIIFAAKDEE